MDNKIEEKKIRHSNMEMLRIVAMSFIMLHHFWCHGMLYKQFTFPAYEILEGFSMGGVDLFIMISGFFGIKLSWKSVVGLALTVAFFFLVNIGVASAIFDNVNPALRLTEFAKAPLSNSGYWFIATYFILMLVSPVVNRGIRSFTLPQLRAVILILSAVEFYSMAVIGNRVDIMGTGIFTFIYLYMLGYYLRQETALQKIPTWVFPTASIVLALISIGIELAILDTPTLKQSMRQFFFKQSNPLTIFSKAAILCWFTRLTFQSRWVNSLATAAFGVYLLQDGIGGEYLYNWQRAMFDQLGFSWSYAALLLGIFIALWLAAWLLTRLKDLWTPWLTDRIVTLIPRSLRQPL